MVITAFLSRSPRLLNRGPGDPASLGHVPHSSIFSPTGLISNCSIGGLRAPSAGCWFSLSHLISNSLTFLCTELYNCSTSCPSSCGRHKSHSIQPVHGQDYILLFLDWMHLLFTQVHFLFWQLGRGQYFTKIAKFLLPKKKLSINFEIIRRTCPLSWGPFVSWWRRKIILSRVIMSHANTI